MNSKCPINELLPVLDSLIQETPLSEPDATKLHSLKHLLTRFTHNESQYIDLSLEKDEYKETIEDILNNTYARGLGCWRKGEPLHLCHVANAMVELITKGKIKAPRRSHNKQLFLFFR